MASVLASLHAKRQNDIEFFESLPEAIVPDRAPKEREQKGDADLVVSELKPVLSFEQFAGQIYDTSSADFSDNSLSSRVRHLNSQKLEFASPPSRFESPLDRFTRLKREVKEFQSELQDLTKVSQTETVNDISKLILKEIGDLESDLLATGTDPLSQVFLQPDVPASLAPQLLMRQKDKQNVQKLLAELDKFSSNLSESKEPQVPSASGAAFPSTNVPDLDGRLAKLERIVGTSRGVSDTVSFPDIWTGLNEIERKLSVLDAQKLDSTQRRVKGLMAEIAELEVSENRLSLNKSPLSAAHLEKINGIWNVISRWDSAAQQLPTVIGRLQSLKDLHEESASIVTRLQSLEQQQDLIDRTLRFDKESLSKFSTTFAANAKVMQENIAAIESRISKLTKK